MVDLDLGTGSRRKWGKIKLWMTWSRSQVHFGRRYALAFVHFSARKSVKRKLYRGVTTIRCLSEHENA